MKSRSVRGFIGEIVVVVLGILIAFGVDASWDRYREVREEREILQDLRRDLRASLEMLEGFTIPLHESTLGASERLLWLIRRPGSPYPGLRAGDPEDAEWLRAWVDSVLLPLGSPIGMGRSRSITVPDSLLGVTLYAGTFDPTLASLDALLASGGLEKVRSRDLRAALAALPARLADARDEEVLTRQLVVGDYRRALRAAGDVVVPEIGDPWLDFGQPFPIPDPLRVRETELRVDDALANVLAARISLGGGALGELHGVAEMMREILALVEQELEG